MKNTLAQHRRAGSSVRRPPAPTTSQPTNITVRETLIGSVSDLLRKSGLDKYLTAQALVDGIVRLAVCKEEGVSLSPELYICSDIRRTLAQIPSGAKLTLGTEPHADSFLAPVLKKCAPLAHGGWHIYAEVGQESVEYGLIRGPLSPMAVNVEDTLFPDSCGSNTPAVLRIHRRAAQCVEVRTPYHQRYNVFLSNASGDTPDPREALNGIVQAICSGVPRRLRETTTTVVSRCLTRGLAASHGALVAVTRAQRLPELFSDATPLLTPIDFTRLVSDLKKHPNESGWMEHLEGASLAVQGMLSCDGVVVFTKSARVLAFNSFVALERSKGKVEGGARKRAFQAMEKHVAKELLAVFLMSQDGWTQLRK